MAVRLVCSRPSVGWDFEVSSRVSNSRCGCWVNIGGVVLCDGNRQWGFANQCCFYWRCKRYRDWHWTWADTDHGRGPIRIQQLRGQCLALFHKRAWQGIAWVARNCACISFSASICWKLNPDSFSRSNVSQRSHLHQHGSQWVCKFNCPRHEFRDFWLYSQNQFTRELFRAQHVEVRFFSCM